MKFPERIDKCPISEAILEIRYSSEYPVDAIFGLIYGEIKDEFKNIKPKTLPILQLPEHIRNNDKNLIYQAYYQLNNNNLSLNIGPRTLVFSNLAPYIGWSKWSTFFGNILNKISKRDFISKIERIGLRYINSFDNNILDEINVDFKINGKDIYSQPANIRTELHEDGLINILQIGNVINLLTPNDPNKRTILDIDCIYNIDKPAMNFFDDYLSYIEYAHNKEKKLFFGLLSADLLEKLKPHYGDEK